MSNSSETAARLLITYESLLPLDRKAMLAERLEAMRKAVEVLNLESRASENPPSAEPSL